MNVSSVASPRHSSKGVAEVEAGAASRVVDHPTSPHRAVDKVVLDGALDQFVVALGGHQVAAVYPVVEFAAEALLARAVNLAAALGEILEVVAEGLPEGIQAGVVVVDPTLLGLWLAEEDGPAADKRLAVLAMRWDEATKAPGHPALSAGVAQRRGERVAWCGHRPSEMIAIFGCTE